MTACCAPVLAETNPAPKETGYLRSPDPRISPKPDKSLGQTAKPPYDYAVPAAGDLYVFVMLASGEGAAQDKDLRARYPKSGLYLSGDAPGFQWGVDWYAYQIYAASDGRHLVRVGDWPTIDSDGFIDVARLGLAFYEDGELLAEYPIKELVEKKWLLQQAGEHYNWIKTLEYDDKNGWLYLVTLDGQEYRFDVRSGLINRMKKSFN